MNIARNMIDSLESRTLMSATLTSADPDEGGEVSTAIYASPTTTSADPDEGGEITVQERRTHKPFVITKELDKSSPVLFVR